jgi:CheY-like chemotaxis protein
VSLYLGVCWIEDQASEAEVDQIKDAVRSAGFEPLITRIETPDDIREFAQRQHHNQDFDLILLDLNLGDGLRGDELASQVRDAFRSTTILFYSAEDEGKLRRRIAERPVEGVYCIHRDRLASRVEELVGHLSPSLNRLSSMRGLAARVVAECDQDFRAILAKLGEEGADTKIAESLREHVVQAAGHQIDEVKKLETLQELLDSHYVHSAALFKEVSDIAFKRNNDELLAIMRKMRRTFPSQVISRRNVLAHALEEQTDTGWHIVRKAGNPVTVADFSRYRREFASQLGNVRRVREILIGEQVE